MKFIIFQLVKNKTLFNAINKLLTIKNKKSYYCVVIHLMLYYFFNFSDLAHILNKKNNTP
ncbi:hypothetical protein SARI_03183 [Salmonella enterica subsp. arizonae serovar 62:z4,z23:-]|uniref:Uncharacterized protein n=1 Tax=Salmonella arizonae (strain ATCC BAA-731 / CDC346-86 / RSK2980) TaxID=41514 RepID=A9MEV4_SALAR|nr:hypothetical protein SARI_03183 [Salmonella enterica subsp. arizonae serovar 62:z4,z23:-]OLV97508.1 hypothetical protein P297_17255 [Salmonella enterica subsp. arizonae serovar 18:z4,z23:- str. CVM N26625]